jgi:glycogen debranching enzyme GlgX
LPNLTFTVSTFHLRTFHATFPQAGTRLRHDGSVLLPPLGAVPDDIGTTFTVFSATASDVQVCLFSGPSGATESRHALQPIGSHLWSGRVAGAGPGDPYGLRVSGPFEPDQGHRYDAAKLLVDPYTRELQGEITPGDALLEPEVDSASAVPRSVIRGAATEAVPARVGGPVDWPDTVLYELHVRGFTQRCPRIPAELRGTYAGLASDPSLEYLTSLGVTSVELLPIHAFASELGLLERGLSNYWGYNSLAFLAPHAPYAAGPDPVAEFRTMVGRLHGAGLEVILDVVYNHTAEGDEKGPTLSFRGLDNATYYRLRPDHARRYEDHTGCGNTLDLRAPVALQLVLDSLRYWVTEMGVDGFRFDLTPALTRGTAFLPAVGQDPILRNVKLIAEPWDLGPDGYQVGHFPTPWAEWNDRYRDTVRDAWRGATTGTAALGYRLSGSSDVFHHNGRRPHASVNFVTAHDGFALADLVSYENKHNRANGEHNRDGDSHNRSFNGGMEGPTDTPQVLTARRRVRRGHLATLLLSAGVPMLVAGDEFGRTQLGNNNAYCQDNEISWLAWPGVDSPDMTNPLDPAGPDPMLLPLVRGLLALRKDNPLLRRADYLRGGPSSPGSLADVTWFRADGQQMTEGDWHSPKAPSLIALLASPDGADRLLIVLHPEASDTTITLPAEPWAVPGSTFALMLNTAADDLAGFTERPARLLLPGDQLVVSAQSVCLLAGAPEVDTC